MAYEDAPSMRARDYMRADDEFRNNVGSAKPFAYGKVDRAMDRQYALTPFMSELDWDYVLSHFDDDGNRIK